LCCLLVNAVLWAQQRQINGTVRKTSGEVLPGVTVSVKGGQNSTSTGDDGKYRINVTGNSTVLVFTYVGFKTMERQVKESDKTIDISLEEATASDLNEVVIVGYQAVRKRDLTGSVSSVNAKQIRDIPINSAAQALAGRLAGVQVTASEGSPNADVQIRVRGGGSITQDNSPLYIIDGVQVENGLSSLSPQDIESVDVLKDASATAIYGSRGANGVVIITTKRGKAGKTTLSYNGLTGLKKLANKLKVMNPYDYVVYQYERSRGNASDSTTFVKYYGTTWDTLNVYRNTPFIDWQDEMFGRNAFMQTHNVSMSGGDAKTLFNLSATYNKEQGIMQVSDFDRKLVSFGLDHNYNSRLKLSFNTRYNNTTVNGAGVSNPGSSAVNSLRQSIRYRPFTLPGQDVDTYDPNYAAETNGNSLSLVNPLLLNEAQYRKLTSTLININGSVSYAFTDWLSFKTTLGYDYFTSRQDAFDDTITYNAIQNGSRLPIASITSSTRGTITNSNVLTYSNAKSKSAFAKDHSITALVGQETYQNLLKGYYQETRNFPAVITPEKALGNMGLGTAAPPSSSEIQEKLISFFGKINYSYKGKYLASFSMRGDGSSKFAEGKRWGYFPSGSVAWRLSSESFFDGLKKVVNDFKIRASYGTAGNNRIGNSLFSTNFASVINNTQYYYGLNDQLVSVLIPPTLANPNLKWESTISKNLGFDASFYKGRISLTGDFYINKTQDLLVNVPIQSTFGYTNQLQNVGSTQNKGMEFQLAAIPVQTKSFSWNTTFNISFNKNKVLSLGPTQTSYLFNSGWAGTNNPADYIVKVGMPVGSMWGYERDGMYSLDDFDYDPATSRYTLKKGVVNAASATSVSVVQPGGIKYKDLNGDGIINDLDKKVIGDANPKFFGGLNQQFTYKNFDLSVFVNFQYGNKVFNYNRLEFANAYTPNANLLDVANNRWRTIDANGNVIQKVITVVSGGVTNYYVTGAAPSVIAAVNANATEAIPSLNTAAFYANSYAVEDASFIRLNNITLGYNIPASLASKMHIQRFRIYATANNIAVITGYSGYDPEVNTRRATPMTPGVDYSAYPRSRNYIVGVNVTF
jgi:TonB-linked SusC/RagA family outer membrane protein